MNAEPNPPDPPLTEKALAGIVYSAELEWAAAQCDSAVKYIPRLAARITELENALRDALEDHPDWVLVDRLRALLPVSPVQENPE